MKRVKYDKNLPVIPAGNRQVTKHPEETTGKPTPVAPLSQEELDVIINAVAGPAAVEKMIREDAIAQDYLLSDGRMLRIWKKTGECHVGCTTNKK